MRITESKLKRIIRNVIAESNSSNNTYNRLFSCIEQELLDAGVIAYPLEGMSYDEGQPIRQTIEDAVSILMSLNQMR